MNIRAKITTKSRYALIAACIAVLLLASGLAVWHANRPTPSTTTNTQKLGTLPGNHGPLHKNVMTSVFWVGEAADAENDHISNVPSAWDEDWQAHYGGFDDPNHRNGYHPATFTPRENPFYFALPYNDFNTDGTEHKYTGGSCLPYTPHTDDSYSWCKNVWIAISYNGKTAYAQWEDVGPNEEDDPDYVFGTAKPKNTFGVHAGLDVSPAVRDYLGLDGDDHTSWTFVTPDVVPKGPWKDIVTTSLGYQL